MREQGQKYETQVVCPCPEGTHTLMDNPLSSLMEEILKDITLFGFFHNTHKQQITRTLLCNGVLKISWCEKEKVFLIDAPGATKTPNLDIYLTLKYIKSINDDN